MICLWISRDTATCGWGAAENIPSFFNFYVKLAALLRQSIKMRLLKKKEFTLQLGSEYKNEECLSHSHWKIPKDEYLPRTTFEEKVAYFPLNHASWKNHHP